MKYEEKGFPQISQIYVDLMSVLICTILRNLRKLLYFPWCPSNFFRSVVHGILA